jgi:hypothetical protein
MFFDDKKYKNKIDLGDKKVLSKDQFLQKMKEDKVKEAEKLKKQENNKMLSDFFNNKCKAKIINEDVLEDLNKNLKSVCALLDLKKDYNSSQKEKLIQNAFNKTTNEISQFSNAYNVHKYSNDILINLYNMLGYLSKDALITLFENNFTIFFNFIVIAIEDLFVNIKKNNLINKDKNLSFFNLFQTLSNNVDFNTIYFSCSNNNSLLYLLNYILTNYTKVIDSALLMSLVKFGVGINYHIKFKNSISDAFSTSLLRIILNNNKLFQQGLGENKSSDILSMLSKIENKSLFNSFNFENIIFIITDINNSLSDNLKRSIHKSLYTQGGYLDIFINCFQILKKKDLSNTILTKYSIDRKTFLKAVNSIIEFSMENDNFSDIEKLNYFIWISGKLIVNLYKSNFEKTEFYSVLDYLFSKIINRYNNKLIDEILKYSVSLIQNKKEVIKNYKVYKKQLEIISFAIITKIEYKDNYIFVDFRGPQDINQNIPFNYMYLNHISKMLIELFTQLINKKNIEELEKFHDNIIIKCLKALYSLDSEIEFSYNRDHFWSNMELISKIATFSKSKQLESIKMMPFVFPFVSRLTVMNSVLSEVKQSRAADLYQHMNLRREDLHFVISRKNIFDDTLLLYLNDRLLPYTRWHITFVNELGIKEEGGK